MLRVLAHLSTHLKDSELDCYLEKVERCSQCAVSFELELYPAVDEDDEDEYMPSFDSLDKWCWHDDSYYPYELHNGHHAFLQSIGLSEQAQADSNDKNNKGEDREKEKNKKVPIVKFNETLVSDFGVQAYFTMFSKGEDGTGLDYNIFAYLIVPSRHTGSTMASNEMSTTFMPTMFLNPSDLVPYTPDLKRKFDIAMNRLGLKPCINPLQSLPNRPTTELRQSAADNSNVSLIPPAHIESLQNSEWPKLVMVSHAVRSLASLLKGFTN